MTDSKALIERLRAKYTVTDEFSTVRRPVNPDGPEAADHIEKLEADNARLCEYLESALDMIREKAWAMYCEETKDSPAAVDFPNQVPRAYWEELLIRAAIRVIAPAVLEEAAIMMTPTNPKSDWTDYARNKARWADDIRAMKTRYEV